MCPSHSTWTSHRPFIGLDAAPLYLDIEWTMDAMGFANTPRGRKEFHELVRSRRHYPRDPLVAGPGTSTLSKAAALVDAAQVMHGFDVRKAITRAERDARLQMIATASETFGLRVDHIAAALELAPSYVSRLRRNARGLASVALVDTYLENEAVKHKVAIKRAS